MLHMLDEKKNTEDPCSPRDPTKYLCHGLILGDHFLFFSVFLPDKLYK